MRRFRTGLRDTRRQVTARLDLLFMAALVLAGGSASVVLAEDVCHIENIDEFLDRCPTDDPALGQILGDFAITKDGVPVTYSAADCTEPVSALPIAQYTHELALLQALRAVYYLDRDRCGHLPWTPLSLYDWLHSQVGGFNINSAATNNSCCFTGPDGRPRMTLRPSDEATRLFHQDWKGLALYIGLLMHEARHVDGFGHVGCCSLGGAACDPEYDEANLSPYGIQYWLERSMIDGTLHTGYTCLDPARRDELKNWYRGAANGHVIRFCTSPPPVLNDVNNPPPPCDSSCLATVTCIPRASGIPPSGGPPRWWGVSPPEPAYHDSLDDPRWSGAAKISYGDGTGGKAEFRAVHDSTHLYLSWRSLVAPASTPDQNTLYFGYRRAGGGDVIVEIHLTSLATIAASSSSMALRAFMRNPDGTEGSAYTLPPDVSTTARVWVDPAPPGAWAAQLRLPIGEAQSTCGRFQLWYQLLSGTPTAPVASVTWPRSGAEVDGGTPASPQPFVYPDPASWHWFRPSTGPGDPACATGGVSLAFTDIGTKNTPPSEIRYSASAPFPANTLFARPGNHTDAVIPSGSITATFRLANWGSVPGDWEAGVPLTDLWATIPGGSDVPISGPIPVGATADDTNEARFDWTVAGADLADFLGGTRRPHQCMLVELRSVADPGVTFTNASVYRNMDVVSASTFERDALISVKALAPVSAEPRDVYIYVETLNMPEKVSVELDPLPTTLAAATPGQFREPAIYRVHVYHDTGRILTLGGTPRPVLRYQTSFGYVVTHEGELEGWRHRLDGPGLVNLAPGWYRIAVPNDGAVSVRTRIESVEPGRWHISFHLGGIRPDGSTRDLYGGGPGGGIDLEYRPFDRFGVELFAGRHLLEGRTGTEDLTLFEASASARGYLLSGTRRLFLQIGAGAYNLDPGGWRGGLHAGAGAQVEFSPRYAIEATFKYHDLAADSPRLRFVTADAGLKIRF